MIGPADYSVPTKVLFIDHTLFVFFFPLFFSPFLLIIAIMGACSKSLGNNLLTYIRENTDSLPQKPEQLTSAEANFKGWSLQSQS